jgi:hypothetical protein
VARKRELDPFGDAPHFEEGKRGEMGEERGQKCKFSEVKSMIASQGLCSLAKNSKRGHMQGGTKREGNTASRDGEQDD